MTIISLCFYMGLIKMVAEYAPQIRLHSRPLCAIQMHLLCCIVL